MDLLSSVEPIGETPVDRFLAEQAELTAVERFAQRHDAELLPVQARYYRDLIPLTAPAPGQQYRFAVDLDACTGCKACVTACHGLNGLDDDESWRAVTTLEGSRQTITTACHHCLDPACLAGCPADAYEKDPVTGIVVHLDDQCIGCSYCTLTCPYDVPVYNPSRGIVRKCDLCRGRLAEGEAPACVQGCPTSAISVEVVDVPDSSVPRPPGQTEVLYPGAPSSAITAPSTVYRSSRAPEALGGQAAPVRRPHVSHLPLVSMLVLTQLSVGLLLADLALGSARTALPAAALSGGLGVAGLLASLRHLGRPRYAYRAVLGIRHSWLSREVVAFAAYVPACIALAATRWLGTDVPGLRWIAAACGVAGIACSVLVYAVTRRAGWRLPVVAADFGATTVGGGLALGLAVGVGPAVAVAVTVVVLAVELRRRDRFFARMDG